MVAAFSSNLSILLFNLFTNLEFRHRCCLEQCLWISGHSLMPFWSVETWGIIHALLGALFTWFGTYQRFENIMKILICTMFITFIGGVFFVESPITSLLLSIQNANSSSYGEEDIIPLYLQKMELQCYLLY